MVKSLEVSETPGGDVLLSDEDLTPASQYGRLVRREEAAETHRESDFFDRDVLPSNTNSIQSEPSIMR